MRDKSHQYLVIKFEEDLKWHMGRVELSCPKGDTLFLEAYGHKEMKDCW